MAKEIISTPEAPSAIGPYSQAVKVGEWLYVSGQIPVDPASGNITSGDIKVQTRRVLQNLQAILRAAGTDLDAVVKTTVYLSNMADFSDMNEIYAEYFPRECPARSTVQAARLPKDVALEVDAIALCK